MPSFQPMKHQSWAVEIAKEHPRYGFFFDCGTGKTIAMLMTVSELGGKTLVLCPKSIMRAAWERDAEHFPLLNVVIAWSNNKPERMNLINTPCDIMVTNYETFKRNYKDFLFQGFDRLIVDESSKLKSPDTQITKHVHLFSEAVDSVYLLSGTPAPNNPTEYWGQLKCIYPQLLPYYKFCYRYFKPIKKKFGEKSFITGWDYLPDRKQEFLTKLNNVSWSLRKEDAVDLPEQIDIIRDVELSAKEQRAYSTMKKQLVAEVESGELVGATVQSRLMKLRQITGGVLYHDERTSEIGNAKLNELLEVLDELGNRQAVIWAEFTADIDRIWKALVERTVNSTNELQLTGIIDGRTKDAAQVVRDFQGGNLQYLICQPQAAGHGITLTAANYAIYYSYGFSYEYHKQSRDRIHRTGQTNHCTYYYLVAKDTCDEAILNCLKNKQSNVDAALEILGLQGRNESTIER